MTGWKPVPRMPEPRRMVRVGGQAFRGEGRQQKPERLVPRIAWLVAQGCVVPRYHQVKAGDDNDGPLTFGVAMWRNVMSRSLKPRSGFRSFRQGCHLTTGSSRLASRPSSTALKRKWAMTGFNAEATSCR